MAVKESRPLTIDEINSLLLFLSNIDWKDPWLIALILFHVSITLTSLLTRNYGNFQVALFLLLLSLVYCSENLNEFAAENWNLFSRQQYFDSNGMFISLVFCAPILLNCMILVASWLYQSSQLMAQLKRAQLQKRLKANTLKTRESPLLEDTMDATGLVQPKMKDD